MKKDPKHFALNKFIMSPEEIEAYSEPSIMDEYIKQNDPEQYNKIVRAKNINQAIGMSEGMGGPMGTVGMLGKFRPIRGKYEKGKHVVADIQKELSKQDLNPQQQQFGKVGSENLPEDQIGKVFTEEEILNKINSLKDTLTSIKERNIPLDEATKKQTMDKVKQLILQKNIAKHSGK